MSHNVRINPRDDVGFVALVDAVAATMDRAPDLERYLRVRYPLAVVRPRGLSGEAIETWYIYRDGSWTSPASPDGDL